MSVVGLTGGIASGKSFVSGVFQKLGALVVDADEIAREVLMPYTPCWNKVVSYFGRAILKDDLTIDRKHLADRIFRNPDERAALNQLVHPAILERIDSTVEMLKRQYPDALVIV